MAQVWNWCILLYPKLNNILLTRWELNHSHPSCLVFTHPLLPSSAFSFVWKNVVFYCPSNIIWIMSWSQLWACHLPALSLYSVWLFNLQATYLCHNLTSVFTTNVRNQNILLEMSGIQVLNVQSVTYTFHFSSSLAMVSVEFKLVILTMILDSVLESTFHGKIIIIQHCLETCSRISLLEELSSTILGRDSDSTLI